MISKVVTPLLKPAGRNYSRVVSINGKDYKVPIDFQEPEYDMDHLQNSSKVILLRHANTVFNLEHDLFLASNGYVRDVLDIQYEEKHRDTPLSEFGVEQAKYASRFARGLDIDLVLISPLRRTLQTAYYLLRTHPNKENMNYVVHPDIREHLVGVSEMTENWENKFIDEYQYYFPNLDSSLMRDEYGQCNELFYCKDMQPELRVKFRGKTRDEIEQLIRESAEQRFPRTSELLECTYDRVKRVKKYIKKHIRNRDERDQHKKVLVITHSLLLKVWTGSWAGMTRPYKGLPNDSLLFSNCEFHPDTKSKYE
ncbi:unnamed protein product [Moneuplotes crassus]|uniref:Uncharacterized protein n=1 Tax=Euplotes crassus TaxID=5936 RepID=A0AAD1XN58_EUPCR|nr:unnamed protein product [Moneuplotes crassus]